MSDLPVEAAVGRLGGAKILFAVNTRNPKNKVYLLGEMCGKTYWYKNEEAVPSLRDGSGLNAFGERCLVMG
jgi:hypothetical protein